MPTPTLAGAALAALLAASEPTDATRTTEAAEATQEPEAAEAPEQAAGFRETVIISTDSKAPQSERNATQNVLVLTEYDLRRTEPVNGNIADLLALQPGFFVSTLSRNDANWGSYGGMGPKYNAYLLDGLPVDPFVDSMALDPWLFERIESVQGPAAVPYGNYLNMDFAGNQSPLAGITQLVARERVEKTETRAAVAGGSWNTLLGRALHQGRSGDLHYVIGGSLERSDYTDYGAPGSWLQMIQSPNYQKTKFYAKGTWYGGEDVKLSLLVSRAGHTGIVGRPNRDYDHGYDMANFTAAFRLAEGVDATLRAGYRGYDRRWSEDNFANNADLSLRERAGVQQRIIPADLTFTWKHLGDSLLTAGVDAQSATYSTTTETESARSVGNDVTASQVSLFVQEKWVSGPLVLRGGARLAWTDQRFTLIAGSTPGLPNQSWTNLLWSAGARWNGPVSVFANAGSSFLAPSAKAVGGTLPPDALGQVGRDGQLPNPDLRPESGISSDLGVEVRVDRTRIVARGFLTVLNDAIVDNRVNVVPSQTQSVNAGRASSYGGELSLDGRVLSGVRWFANASLVNSTIENELDSDQNGAQIPFVPDWSANAGVIASLPWEVTVAPTLRVVGTFYDSTSISGRQAFGNFVVPSMTLSKVLRGEGYRINFALDLNNFSNNRFLMPWGFRDPGFNALARAEVSL